MHAGAQRSSSLARCSPNHTPSPLWTGAPTSTITITTTIGPPIKGIPHSHPYQLTSSFVSPSLHHCPHCSLPHSHSLAPTITRNTKVTIFFTFSISLLPALITFIVSLMPFMPLTHVFCIIHVRPSCPSCSLLIDWFWRTAAGCGTLYSTTSRELADKATTSLPKWKYH